MFDRKKRRISAESQSTPTNCNQNALHQSASDASSSGDVSPLRNEAIELKNARAGFMDSTNEGSSSSLAPPLVIKQTQAPNIKHEKEDEEMKNRNPDQTDAGVVATAERGTQFSRRIKEENNSEVQATDNSNQIVYIDSDDDDDISEFVPRPTEALEQKHVKEPVQNKMPFSLNCFHQSTQTEETWPHKDYKSLFEKAGKKINQLVSNRADLLEGAWTNPSRALAEEDLGDITWQVDSLVQELDHRTRERNQLLSQVSVPTP